MRLRRRRSIGSFLGHAAAAALLALGSAGAPARAEPPITIALAVEEPREPAPLPPRREPTVVSITLVGDTGFGGDRQPVRRDGALRHGTLNPWVDLFSAIRPHITGDLAFANLESVVSERNDLPSEDKIFAFRSHPEGVAQFLDLGFNLLSTANNHSMDYGQAGALDTLTALDALVAGGKLKAHAGLARTRLEALVPRAIEVKGARVLFSAIGIISGGHPLHRVGATRPGQLAYQSPEDFDDVTRNLAEATGDYRILSVHHGQERVVHTSPDAIAKLRVKAVLGRGIDLVVGHHSHVIAGAEITDGRVILYGLGNFLHPGMQSSAHLGPCKDFGLMARVHLVRLESGRLVARAIEAVPLTGMHLAAAPMGPGKGAERIEVLNHLAAALDDPATGARGLRFTPRPDGSGVHCVPGAADDPAPIGPMCRDIEPPAPLAPALRARLAAACNGGGQSPLVGAAPSPPKGLKGTGTGLAAAAGPTASSNPFAGN